MKKLISIVLFAVWCGGVLSGQEIKRPESYNYLRGHEALQNDDVAGLKLETGDDNSRLVDMFNQSSTNQEFQTAWENATSEERTILILAVLDYPYEQ